MSASGVPPKGLHWEPDANHARNHLKKLAVDLQFSHRFKKFRPEAVKIPDTDVHWLFVDPGVSENDPELRLYITKLHIDTRKDVNVVHLSREDLIRAGALVFEGRKKPTLLGREWWNGWKRASWVKPTKSEHYVGVALASAHTGISFAISYFGTDVGLERALYASVFTFIVSSVIAVYNKTYKRVIHRGSKAWQVFKMTVGVSYLYSVFITAFLGAPTLLFDWSLQRRLVLNFIANNYAKLHGLQIPLLREKYGMVKGDSPDAVRRNETIEYQGTYTGIFCLKFADIVGIRFCETLEDLLNIRMSSLVLYLSVPVLFFAKLRYAKKHGLPEYEQYRRELRDFVRLVWLRDGLKRVGKLPGRLRGSKGTAEKVSAPSAGALPPLSGKGRPCNPFLERIGSAEKIKR